MSLDIPLPSAPAEYDSGHTYEFPPDGGVAGQVMTSNGPNSDPTWQNAGGLSYNLPLTSGVAGQVLTSTGLSSDPTWQTTEDTTGLFSPPFVFVRSLDDLPTPSGGVITLVADASYYFTTAIDLQGNRLVCSGVTSISGVSSETSSIISTGLSAATPMIYSQYTLPMRNITLTAGYAVHIENNGSDIAIDWNAVNFINCANTWLIDGVDNFIYTNGAVINSANMIFDGNINTIAAANSLFVILAGETGWQLNATLTVARRFRIIYSAMFSGTGSSGIDVIAGASVPDENFILDSVNFSGPGDYVSGLTVESLETIYIACVGITNTSIFGSMFIADPGDVLTTAITDTTSYFPVAGITTGSTFNQKYTHTNNRLTVNAARRRKYLVSGTVSFLTNLNNVCHFAIYDSTTAAVRPDSDVLSTANRGNLGRAENVSFSCVIEHVQGDYISIYVRNEAGNNVDVIALQVTITGV